MLGGYDATGPQLFTVAPHGSTDKLPYVTMGSGSLAAMAVFESGWVKDMSVSAIRNMIKKCMAQCAEPTFWDCPGLCLQREDAVNLVVQAICSGIFNDLGSGSNVDVCVIKEKETEMLRNYLKPNERAQKQQRYGFARGTTGFTREQIYSMIKQEDVLEVGKPTPVEGETMDTS